MKNTKVSKVLLIFTFIISMLINLTPVYAANKKVKMPERAVDGSRLIYSYAEEVSVGLRVSAVSDGKYIYYTTDSSSGPGLIKRNIKTGQETGITRHNYYSLYMYKNILLGTYITDTADYIEKISKTGKVKELAEGYLPIGWGNSIYYNIGSKGLYKMNVNGKRKKLVKKGISADLGTSGKNLYYYNWGNEKWFGKWINVKTGKPESSVTFSRLYDIASKTKFTYGEKEVKAGKYENGKWKYKTILKYNKPSEYSEGIWSVCVCGGKVLVLIKGDFYSVLYIMDLDGKNKTLLHKMKLSY